jgi:protein phosphatase
VTDVPGIRIAAFGRTDVGRHRADNQDRFLVMGLDGADPVRVGSEGEAQAEPVHMDRDRGAVLLVADGMGGRKGGARASGIVVDVVTHELTADRVDGDGDAFAHRLRSALCEANRAIHAEASSDGALTGMGTTATLVGVLGDMLYVAQVGDSRAYLVRQGERVRLTRDQSLVQDMIDSGILDESEARSVPNNMLLQALGVRSKVHPAVTFHPVQPGDVVLLCSDGLTQVLDDEEIVEAVGTMSELVELCEALVTSANDRGGPDNVTVVAARVHGPRLAGPDASEPLSVRRWKRGRPLS